MKERRNMHHTKVDLMDTISHPQVLGLMESLQEQQNNLQLRSQLTVDAIKHFVQLYSNYQGHFPWLHMSTFNFIDAYDGLILAIICAGAVYSDQISQTQVRSLILKVKRGVERTSHVWNRFTGGLLLSDLATRYYHLEELQALLICQSLIIWHGGRRERKHALADNQKISQLVRELGMTVLASSDSHAYSYLHNLVPGEQADPSLWSWNTWLEQEKRSRLMFMAFLLDAALVLYFNCVPSFQASEIKLPLPCDDAAWEAPDAETCARALGLRGSALQSQVNVAGSLRLKQLEMHHAVSALHNSTLVFQPRTTNVYGKFILIHALHVEISQLQKQRSSLLASQASTPDELTDGATAKTAKSIYLALDKWKKSWDEDQRLQYPHRSGPASSPKRSGFCRDGVQFYWLARVLLPPTRSRDWKLPAEVRFRQVLGGLKGVREWSRTDGAERGEEPGSVAHIDDDYASETSDLDMRKLFKPLHDIFYSPIRATKLLPHDSRRPP